MLFSSPNRNSVMDLPQLASIDHPTQLWPQTPTNQSSQHMPSTIGTLTAKQTFFFYPKPGLHLRNPCFDWLVQKNGCLIRSGYLRMYYLDGMCWLGFLGHFGLCLMVFLEIYVHLYMVGWMVSSRHGDWLMYPFIPKHEGFWSPDLDFWETFQVTFV